MGLAEDLPFDLAILALEALVRALEPAIERCLGNQEACCNCLREGDHLTGSLEIGGGMESREIKDSLERYYMQRYGVMLVEEVLCSAVQ